MKVAIVDHSFHRRTASSAFFIELLEECFSVSVFYDESWKTGKVDPDLPLKLLDGGFDKFVFYQVFWPAELFQHLGFRKVLFVPMYDDVRKRSDEWWSGYRGNSFISFSRALDKPLKDLGSEVLPVQYFPSLQEVEHENGEALVGFFWQRSRELSWKTVLEVAGGNDWDRFHLHYAPDPGFPGPRKPSRTVQKKHSIRVSEWFEKAEDFRKVMSSANVYFAPRLFEGIGMGFLEAMSSGQCVVAPNTATHNEYIVHGQNGLLYDPESPSPVSLEGFRQMGEAARESCRAGFEHWKHQRNEIQEFVKVTEQHIERDKMKNFLESTPSSNHVWRTRAPLGERIANRLVRTFRRKA